MFSSKLVRNLVLAGGVAAAGLPGASPAMAEGGFDLLRSYYAVDAHLPIALTVVSDTEVAGVRRVEFTYSAYDNQIVPARLDIPLGVDNPPVIIALHGITQSRAQWWREDHGPYSFPSRHRQGLTDAGFAVLAIDARVHGDRMVATDFPDQSIYLRESYFDAGRKIIAETVIDVRRAIDAAEEIDGIDTDRIGVTGFSLGAFIGYLAAAVDPRIDAGMIMAMPFLPVTEGEVASFTSQFNYVEGLAGKPMGFIAGTRDPLYTREAVDALEAAMQGQPEVTWVESEHDLPEDTAAISVAFFERVF